jgi:hypothetical protein
MSLFKVIKRKYVSQGKCEFMIFLFVVKPAYLPRQLLHMLFLTPFINISKSFMDQELKKMAEKMLKYFLMLNLNT